MRKVSIELLTDTDPWHPRANIAGGPWEVPAEGELLDTTALQKLLTSLSERDQELLFALYWERKAVRQIARESGVVHRSIQKRRNRILRKLREGLAEATQREPSHP